MIKPASLGAGGAPTLTVPPTTCRRRPHAAPHAGAGHGPAALLCSVVLIVRRTLVLIVLLTVLILTAGAAHADRVTPAARVKTHVTVRAKPASTAKAKGQLKAGESAAVLKTLTYWHQVRLDNGVVGYVSRAWTTPVTAAATAALVITFVDVGQGDAILLQLDDVDLLVDAGTAAAWDPHLKARLASVRGPLEGLFLTHPHDDHYGAAADVLGAFEVQAVTTNGERRGAPRDEKKSPTWEAFEAAVAAEGLSFATLTTGQTLTPATGLVIRVLAAGGQFPDTATGADINNDSLVLLVEYGGRRILLTGDIEPAAGQQLVADLCTDGAAATCPALRADVLKLPHHGSAKFDPAFFTAVAPAWAVLSADYQNKKHCLPRRDPIDALAALGAKIVSTSADGEEDVVLTVTAAGVLSWTWPSKDVFYWDKASAACVGRTRKQGE